MLQKYEMLYLLPGDKTEEEVPALASQVHELIKSQGANITKNDFWGKRKLAYEINKMRFGFYEVIEFEMESTKLNLLDAALRMNPLIMRHQIVVREVLTPEQEAAKAKLRERIAAHREVVKEKASADVIKHEPVVAPVEPEPAGPVEQKQLDEKLEEILESDKVQF